MTTQPSGAPLSSSLLQRAFLESAAQSDEAADPTAERLLDAAFELFCRLGVQRTPMEKVAKSAGVTRVTLYRKFATKDALVDQVVLREFRRYFDRFRAEIPRADTVADRVVVGFVGSLRAISGNPLIGEIFVNRGAALIGKSRYAEAVAEIDKGIGLGVEEAHKAYFNRALAREGLDDMKGAYLDYRTAIKLEPTFELAQAQLTRFTVVRR